MEDYMELIGNSGVLITYAGARILIDGIFTGGQYFSQLPREMKKAVFGMESVYRDIEYFLFTHRHLDHFSLEYMKEYLHHNQVKAVFMPQVQNKKWDKLEPRREMEEHFFDVVTVYEGEFGEFTEIQLQELCKVRFYRSRHLGGADYAGTVHYMIELILHNQSYLFTADADVKEDNFAQLISKKRIKTVFVNPLFFQNPKGRRLLEKLYPKQVVIYHMPFAEDDQFFLRKIAQESVEKFQTNAYEAVLFSEPKQRLGMN